MMWRELWFIGMILVVMALMLRYQKMLLVGSESAQHHRRRPLAAGGIAFLPPGNISTETPPPQCVAELVREGVGHRMLQKSDFTLHWSFLCDSDSDYCAADIESGATRTTSYIGTFSNFVEERYPGRKLQRSERMFVDIGAHGGFHSFNAAMYGYEVLAFEPLYIPSLFFEANLCLNHFYRQSISIVRKTGLSHANYSCPVHFDQCYSSSTLSSKALSLSSAKQSGVSYRPLDDLVLPSLELVKMDVGVNTARVLLGMIKTLTLRDKSDTRPPTIGVVCVRVPLSVVKECTELLWDLGYSVSLTDFGVDSVNSREALSRVLASSLPTVYLYAIRMELADASQHLNDLLRSSV